MTMKTRTGLGLMTLASSVSLLHQYCATLLRNTDDPSDFVPSIHYYNVVHFDSTPQFQCRLELPHNCPLSDELRVQVGQANTKKWVPFLSFSFYLSFLFKYVIRKWIKRFDLTYRDAKRIAAFEACKILYYNGCLDERLLPTISSLKQVNKESKLRVSFIVLWSWWESEKTPVL